MTVPLNINGFGHLSGVCGRTHKVFLPSAVKVKFTAQLGKKLRYWICNLLQYSPNNLLGILKFDQKRLLLRGRGPPPGKFLISKGFSMQSKAYWALAVSPSVYHEIIRKPLNKLMIFFWGGGGLKPQTPPLRSTTGICQTKAPVPTLLCQIYMHQ